MNNTIQTNSTSLAASKARDGKRLFNENQVSRIVGERLARERKNNVVLSEIRDMVMTLVKDGIIKSRNISEIGDELSALISQISGKDAEKTRHEKAQVQAYGAERVTDEDSGVKDEAIVQVEPESIAKAEEAKAATENNISDEVKEFIRLFPDVDLTALLNDPDFRSFADSGNARGSVSMVYIAYLKDIASRLKEENAKKKKQFTNGLASTGFSAKAGGGEDYSELLTPAQMRIARDAGMSYKEYSDYLSQIKNHK